MIEPKNQKLIISRQCKILGINRSSCYYRPKPIKQEDLDLMRKIDELYLVNPSSEDGKSLRLGLAKWIQYYNLKRGHSAFDDKTPDEVYFGLPPQFGEAA